MIFTSPGIYNPTGIDGLYIGVTFQRVVTFPYDLTGYAARWFAKAKASDSAYIFDYSTGDVSPKLVIVPGVSSSTLTFKIPASDTDDFDQLVSGYHELRLSISGNISPVLIGAIDFLTVLPR